MEIFLKRFRHGQDSTLGLLSIENEFVCFTCEDQFQAVKIKGETRIPAGRYQVELRTSPSPMNKRYAQRFDFHKGMLWLQDVPGFTWVYIHVGNDDDDTDGCVLLGMDAYQTNNGGKVGRSIYAYSQLYPVIVEALEQGQDVYITIED